MQIEIPEDLTAAIGEIAATTGQDTGSLVTEMVTEAIKMRRVPGILFAHGATGRRARVGGAGIKVIGLYEAVGRDRRKVQEIPLQLNSHHIDMAISHYEAYAEDITPYLLAEQEIAAWKRSGKRTRTPGRRGVASLKSRLARPTRLPSNRRLDHGRSMQCLIDEDLSTDIAAIARGAIVPFPRLRHDSLLRWAPTAWRQADESSGELANPGLLRPQECGWWSDRHPTGPRQSCGPPGPTTSGRQDPELSGWTRLAAYRVVGRG